MSKFKVGDVVKRKDGLPLGNEYWGDILSETAVVIESRNGMNFFVGRKGFYNDSLLELVSSGPVRETIVIKKEIIPGTYGDVVVSATPKRIYLATLQQKDKLVEAIKTLQLIRDAME